MTAGTGMLRLASADLRRMGPKFEGVARSRVDDKTLRLMTYIYFTTVVRPCQFSLHIKVKIWRAFVGFNLSPTRDRLLIRSTQRN